MSRYLLSGYEYEEGYLGYYGGVRKSKDIIDWKVWLGNGWIVGCWKVEGGFGCGRCLRGY